MLFEASDKLQPNLNISLLKLVRFVAHNAEVSKNSCQMIHLVSGLYHWFITAKMQLVVRGSSLSTNMKPEKLGSDEKKKKYPALIGGYRHGEEVETT